MVFVCLRAPLVYFSEEASDTREAGNPLVASAGINSGTWTQTAAAQTTSTDRQARTTACLGGHGGVQGAVAMPMMRAAPGASAGQDVSARIEW